MSDPIYDEFAALASELLGEFGALATITRKTKTFDNVAGSVTGETTDSYPAEAAFFPASAGTIAAFDNRTQKEYLKGGVRFLIASGKDATFEPENADVVTFNEEEYFVVGATPLSPRGRAVIFNMGVRKV